MIWAVIKAMFRRRTCPTCTGKGYLPISRPGSGVIREVSCDECLGTGLAFVRAKAPL